MRQSRHGKPLLARERDRCLCPLSDCVPLPAELMEPGRKDQGNSQAVGVRQLLGQGERLAGSSSGLGPDSPGATGHRPQDRGKYTPGRYP